MKTRFVFLFAAVLALTLGSLAVRPLSAGETEGFFRNLSFGDRGADVFRLQRFLNADPDTVVAPAGPGSPGKETAYFGLATKRAVIRFQEKYKDEVLSPARLPAATGFVGPLTRAKLNSLLARGSAEPKPPVAGRPPAPPTGSSSLPTTPSPEQAVKILSVSPSRVWAGDTVKIFGEGFTPVGNSVTLHYGLIEKRFENLPSPDGKSISFVYQPPELKTMSEAEIRALPPSLVSQLEGPARQAGATLGDILKPYKGLRNKEELASFLEKNGRSIDDLYDLYYITVQNTKGEAMSGTALLYGMRKLSFESAVSLRDPLLTGVSRLLRAVMPEAAAARPGGGFKSQPVMYCTCGGGHLSIYTSITGGGGFFYFPPGFTPLSGTTVAPGQWIGFTSPGGICSIYAGITCFTITGDVPILPWGASS